MADPYDSWGSMGGDYANVQPTTNSSSTSSFNGGGGGFDWGSNITSWMKLAPNLISSIKGNSYGQTQYGQQGGQTGLQIGGQVPFLGGGTFGLDGNMILLLAVAAVAIFALKK